MSYTIPDDSPKRAVASTRAAGDAMTLTGARAASVRQAIDSPEQVGSPAPAPPSRASS